MDYSKELEEFGCGTGADEIAAAVAGAREKSAGNMNVEVLRKCFGMLDLTSLNADDSAEDVTAFVEKAVALHGSFPDMPNVASVCVYPVFVDVAGLAAGSSGIAVGSVAGGFPSAQTYLEVKMLEVAMAVENGADEVDVVMNPGQMLAGEYEVLGSEIALIGDEAGEDAVLKVIIETGVLKVPAMIRRAALLAMLAGADFVKTSTGKEGAGATPEAAVAVCRAIKDYHAKTGRKVGFKVAGGVRTAEEAVLYYTIVEQELGPGWLVPSLFRIGASSLANDLLSAVEGREVVYF